MAVCQLGNLKWRVDPNSINWTYQIDTNRIETLGGQVIQVLGSTLGDLNVSGLFGQDHANKLESWQLALAFHTRIQQMIDAQTLPAKTVNLGPSNGVTDAAVVHQPITLNYLDGKHDWSFKVLIKAISDADGSASLTHSSGKFSYGYRLTLFIVESNTDLLSTVATDLFINNIAQGLGWKRSVYQGKMTASDAMTFLSSNGGSVSAYIDKTLTGG
jgi:hypothetical protein